MRRIAYGYARPPTAWCTPSSPLGKCATHPAAGGAPNRPRGTGGDEIERPSTWQVYADDSDALAMATHPDATRANFPRDMQWGQGLQLIEDMDGGGEGPVPFVVRKGELLELTTRFSVDGVTMQFQLERAAPGATIDAEARGTHIRFGSNGAPA